MIFKISGFLHALGGIFCLGYGVLSVWFSLQFYADVLVNFVSSTCVMKLYVEETLLITFEVTSWHGVLIWLVCVFALFLYFFQLQTWFNLTSRIK